MTDRIDIRIEAAVWAGAMDDPVAVCRAAARAALAVAPPAQRTASVSVLLSDDAAVRRLNRSYRGRDEATDVLSFAQSNPGAPDGAGSWPGSGNTLLGDIVVAFGVTAQEAAADGKSMDDHLSHLIVHGVLHLLGYDHEDDADAEIMERLETRVLASLGVPDPYEGVADRQT